MVPVSSRMARMNRPCWGGSCTATPARVRQYNCRTNRGSLTTQGTMGGPSYGNTVSCGPPKTAGLYAA